ncbi:MAG: ATP-binding cassette domain-containing protein [Oscillospiraceae bacterium]|nr:ATP-binding cassette domain-containing protein [Oscillospiraceae bacterium]
MNELTLQNVTKKYGQKTALDGCSLIFKTGINALLGPNGSGKTTMMNIIADLIPANSGSVLWNGASITKLGAEYRGILGFMPQNVNLYKRFSAADNLRYFGKLKGLSTAQIEEDIPLLLEKVNLADCVNKKFGSFSGGMKQRLGIAVTIMNKPKLVIFDEPTAGLDPKERMRFRDILRELSEDAVVILSTHIVSDVEMLADNIILLKEGKVCESGTAEELQEKYTSEASSDRTVLETVYMNFFGEG